MLVLSQQNDPFYAGNGAEGDKARWFAELWERFGYSSGVHLRRVHYRIVSEGNILKPDGKLYENDRACWEYMQGASRRQTSTWGRVLLDGRRRQSPDGIMSSTASSCPE